MTDVLCVEAFLGACGIIQDGHYLSRHFKLYWKWKLLKNEGIGGKIG